MMQAEWIRIGKEHFLEVILPKIKEISAQATDNLLVFIEGSAAYGYCDENSDVDIDFYIDMELSDELRKQITNLFCGETYWKDSVRVSYGFGGEYWKIRHIVSHDMDRFWQEFNPYAVNSLAQAIPVWDPKNLLPVIKERIGFYPEELKKSVIRGLWLTVNDSGVYNCKAALDRGKISEAKIYLYRAVEAMLRLAFILNNRYYPPTKWLSDGLKQLNNDFGTLKLLDAIERNDEFAVVHEWFMEVCHAMIQYMSDNQSIEQESVDHYASIFRKPFYIFPAF